MLRQMSTCFPRVFFAHPAGDERFGQVLGQFDQGFGDAHRVGHGLRRQNHQQTINVFVGRHQVDGVTIALGGRIATDVDRIGV